MAVEPSAAAAAMVDSAICILQPKSFSAGNCSRRRGAGVCIRKCHSSCQSIPTNAAKQPIYRFLPNATATATNDAAAAATTTTATAAIASIFIVLC